MRTYFGPPLKSQAPPKRVIPAHLAHLLPDEADAASAGSPANARPLVDLEALPTTPPTATAARVASARPRAGTWRARVVAWIASQSAPVTREQIAIACPRGVRFLSERQRYGIKSRSYDTPSGRITEYWVTQKPWPPLPDGARLVGGAP